MYRGVDAGVWSCSDACDVIACNDADCNTDLCVLNTSLSVPPPPD